MLADFDMTECFNENTPLDDQYHKLIDPDSEAFKNCNFKSNIQASYRTVVGKLMYAMVGTRPDIATAVSVASRSQESPRPIHWKIVDKIVRYLKKTAEFGIKYTSAAAADLQGYMDADFAA
jgi:hypothetical protein